MISNYSQIRAEHFYDITNTYAFTQKVGYDSEGIVKAKYCSLNGPIFYEEEVGQLDFGTSDCWEKFENIYNRHVVELRRTLRKIRDLDIPIKNAIALEVFQECRNIFIEEKKKIEADVLKRQKLTEFIKHVEKRMQNEFKINIHMIKGLEVKASLKKLEKEKILLPPVIVTKNGENVLVDTEWPLEASFARLLLINRYNNIIPLPSLHDLVFEYNEATCRRLEIINMISEYELYSEDKLIFKQSGNKLDFHDRELFGKLCIPLKENPLYNIIDKKFIENAIKRKHVPEESRSSLEKFIGLSIVDAIQFKTNVYGNLKKVMEITHEEIDALDLLDQQLFDLILGLCSSDLEKQRQKVEELKADKLFFIKLQHRYEYFKGDNKEQFLQTEPVFEKIKRIYDYLSAEEINKSLLNLKTKSLPELLKFTKMFDLALSCTNSLRRVKITFQQGSYNLRKLILEKIPNFCSFEVFSKTLFNKRISEVSYMANSNNWVGERVGLQAKMYANTIILAVSLSKRISLISGARGNTASGKSTSLRHKKGVLNTDPIKFGLRKETDIKNHQIHVEGAMIFDLCFDEIANHSLINFVVDLRMIRVEDIKHYLIAPAIRRNCKVVLNDFDVPLITSLNRVLNRDPKGKDPIPSLDPMKSGFQGIRNHREQVIAFVKEQEIIGEYNLYYLGNIVAKKENGEFIILNDEGYKKCLDIPLDQELDDTLKRTIDDEYIREALIRGDLKQEESDSLECWKGATLKVALETHANKV